MMLPKVERTKNKTQKVLEKLSTKEEKKLPSLRVSNKAVTTLCLGELLLRESDRVGCVRDGVQGKVLGDRGDVCRQEGHTR